MTKSGSAKRLWDNFLKLDGLIYLHMALDIYKLNGEVPGNVITSDTADISTVESNGWYDWIKLYDPVSNSFPEYKYYFGHYLGPEIDIGPALAEKILKMNGKVVHQYICWSLPAQDMNKQEDLRHEFDKKTEEKLGPNAMVKYFDDINMVETPTFEIYGGNDGVKGTPDKLPEDLEPTPDLWSDVNLNASIVFPRGDNMDRGEVVSWKQDVDGNSIVRENANPILDSRWYEVEFDDGEVTDLTENIIVERMYDQCDENWNALLLLDSLTDYWK